MEIIYAIFYTIGIMLLISHFEEYLSARILRVLGCQVIEAEIIGLIILALWMIITHGGSLLFVIIYSAVITAIGILISYHLTMGEQERIDKHSFIL